MTDFLILAFLFLAAGVISVPIASRLGLGSVLGYLIAGIAISPLLSALHVDVVSIQHFAEFGVVMMLFLVGLELEPKMLWQMKTRLLGLGGLQVGLTLLGVAGIAMLFGQQWSVSLAIGMVLALSSTAIVLQTLNEKGLMKSDGGQSSFSVLLFQDIAVIPMLAILPLLALPELAEVASHASDGHGGDGDHGTNIDIMSGLPGWAQGLVTLGAVGLVIAVGTVLTRPLFNFVASAGLRELFTATALMMVVGIALLMTLVGLSPALGTFLAGVVLANSEYRHELESDIDPFKGLLLGLFFITVGAGVNFALLFENFGSVIAMTLGLIALKAGILIILAKVFNVNAGDKWLFSLGLAQAGEFGFVLLSFTVANHVIPKDVADQLLLVVALSMLLTPALFILYDKVIAPRYAATTDKDPDDITEKGNVIIAGHGRFGGIINRLLSWSGHKTVVLDYSASQLEMLRAFGVKAFYGDASRPDLLHAAGIEDAELFIVAIDDKDKATEMVHYVHHTYPHVKIIARAIDRQHVYELYAAGCREIIRETFDSSIRAARTALEMMGSRSFDAELMVQDFIERDRHIIQEMAPHYDPDIPIHKNEALVAKTKELMQAQEEELLGKTGALSATKSRAWNFSNRTKSET